MELVTHQKSSPQRKTGKITQSTPQRIIWPDTNCRCSSLGAQVLLEAVLEFDKALRANHSSQAGDAVCHDL